MWQALYEELAPLGVEVVSVALDLGGVDAVRPWIEAASPAPSYPVLIDQAHLTDELLGFVNVPMAVWVDESGTLVQPAHVAQVTLPPGGDRPLPDNLPDELRSLLETVRRIPRTSEPYLAALRDWAARGSASEFVLSPDQVVARSKPRSSDDAEAAACFELGQYLWRGGDRDAAVPWFRRAHSLAPDNWTYKRQAWTLATTAEGAPSDLLQPPTDLYEGSWYADVSAAGPENYYPPLELRRSSE